MARAGAGGARPGPVERFNAASHLAGAGLALVALVALVARAAGDGDRLKLAGFVVYGTSLVTLYAASSTYHAVEGRLKPAFRTLDHVAITFLIAGTYTPFALVTLRGRGGLSLLAAIWALAALGTVTALVPQARRLSLALYLAMGWLALPVMGPLASALRGSGLAWVLLGGIFYTTGAAFYALDRRWPAAHGVFHVLVLAGSASHFVAIWIYVA